MSSWMKRYASLAHEDWMKECADSLQLNEVIIPGTHDSGTFGCSRSSVATPWSKSQDADFEDQLFAGIRYFDLRVKPFQGKKARVLACFHGSCDAMTAHIGTMIEQVNTFVRRAEQKEIVILHFARFHETVGVKDVVKLLHMLKKNLNEKLLKPGDLGAKATLRSVWDSPGRVIVLWRMDQPDNHDGRDIPTPEGDPQEWTEQDQQWAKDTVWPEQEYLFAPEPKRLGWANTTRWDDLKLSLERVLAQFSPANTNQFLRLQAVFTPPDRKALARLVLEDGGSILHIAKYLPKYLEDWKLANLADTLNAYYLADWLVSEPMRRGAGIVSVDYFDHFRGLHAPACDSVFVNTVIGLNSTAPGRRVVSPLRQDSAAAGARAN